MISARREEHGSAHSLAYRSRPRAGRHKDKSTLIRSTRFALQSASKRRAAAIDADHSGVLHWTGRWRRARFLWGRPLKAP